MEERQNQDGGIPTMARSPTAQNAYDELSAQRVPEAIEAVYMARSRDSPPPTDRTPGNLGLTTESHSTTSRKSYHTHPRTRATSEGFPAAGTEDKPPPEDPSTPPRSAKKRGRGEFSTDICDDGDSEHGRKRRITDGGARDNSSWHPRPPGG